MYMGKNELRSRIEVSRIVKARQTSTMKEKERSKLLILADYTEEFTG